MSSESPSNNNKPKRKTLQVKYTFRGAKKQFKFSVPGQFGKYTTCHTLDETKQEAKKLGYNYLNINNQIMEKID